MYYIVIINMWYSKIKPPLHRKIAKFFWEQTRNYLHSGHDLSNQECPALRGFTAVSTRKTYEIATIVFPYPSVLVILGGLGATPSRPSCGILFDGFIRTECVDDPYRPQYYYYFYYYTATRNASAIRRL